MTNSKTIDPSQPSILRLVIAVLRAWAGSRLGLILIAGVAIVAGLGFNWSWLVAAGLAPLILGVLPCAAMCALGLCMMGMSGKKAVPGSSSDSTPTPTRAPAPDGNELLEAQASSDGVYKVE
jgi:hypothetical protein